MENSVSKLNVFNINGPGMGLLNGEFNFDFENMDFSTTFDFDEAYRQTYMSLFTYVPVTQLAEMTPQLQFSPANADLPQNFKTTHLTEISSPPSLPTLPLLSLHTYLAMSPQSLILTHPPPALPTLSMTKSKSTISKQVDSMGDINCPSCCMIMFTMALKCKQAVMKAVNTQPKNRKKMTVKDRWFYKDKNTLATL
ncbi:hypothetical protein CPB84DRAFT_1852473 [Gymnopilus junonius]|uniref:Uncharacterized protein n=1 Tax=Gymnopilus junonius TaxID=109634 RepID=A0A9P5NBS6_GYMJU|nr:hypothetical protein CPB84DRAFT_1852473 [Gymnopilus junonius]